MRALQKHLAEWMADYRLIQMPIGCLELGRVASASVVR